MKLLNHVLCLLAISIGAKASKLDLATHNSLIQKLESAVGTESSDKMLLQTNMAYRLADLYSERARLLSMDQEGQGDKIHADQILSDRKKAVAIWAQIIPSLDKSDRGSALMQKAHLHVMMQQPGEALKILKTIEKSPSDYDGKTNALVYIQLGDVAFQKEDFQDCKTQFEKALKIKENPRRGYSQFRIAWVNYNQGQTAVAEKQLTALLKNASLYTSKDGVVDSSFQEEVSHDLALFMAKNDINNASIQNLSELSPVTARKKNLIFLASELDRTAKKEGALKVWKIVGENSITFEDQLERQIQVTRIEYDLGHKESLVVEIGRAVVLLKSSKCSGNAECTVANQNLRRVITDWAKAEERTPSAALILAFQRYTNAFEDYEMSYYAAQAAARREQYKIAYDFQMQASQLLAVIKSRNEVQQKMFEGSLLGAIEQAELAKNPDLRIAAYKKYLELNPHGAKINEVKYQIAHSLYEKNDYINASIEFKKLVRDLNMPADLREKSADLALDSNVLLKNEMALEQDSLEYAQLLPQKKAEYLVIYQKAVLNQTAKVLNTANSNSAFETELRKLNALRTNNFNADEAKLLVKNKIELSYRLRDIETLTQNANALLAMKKISFEEKEMALRHLTWIAEVKMNFSAAIKYLGRIQPIAKNRAEYYFKMATLQELSNQNPSASYENFISFSHESDKKAFAAHQIVLNSKNPAKSFSKYENLLVRNPELYSSAGIFTFEKNKDARWAQHLLARSTVRKTFNGQLLAHTIALEALKQNLKAISKTSLKGLSDANLKRALVKRNAQLKGLEKLANKSIQTKDTSLQLIYLSHVSEENNRLAHDITSLAAPRGLKATEKAQYQAQVKQMVQPYLAQAVAVQTKMQDLWKQALAKNSLTEISECLVGASKPGCVTARTEILALRESSKIAGLAVDPFEKLSEVRQKTLSESESLKEKIKANPFNLSDLAKMKSLQTSLGRGPMVAYLDQRLTELQTKRVHNAN
ncbi:MAG: hypothetical protein H7328_10795 [Bdellovibrio sp.]|nr:hypothetical protein [Bdellovibrio sp.]